MTKTKAEPVVNEEEIVLDDNGDTHVTITGVYSREDIIGVSKRLNRAALAAN